LFKRAEGLERLHQRLQATARGPNPAREAISSAPRSHFVNDEKNNVEKKTAKCAYDKFVDLVEYNISRNNHIT